MSTRAVQVEMGDPWRIKDMVRVGDDEDDGDGDGNGDGDKRDAIFPDRANEIAFGLDLCTVLIARNIGVRDRQGHHLVGGLFSCLA
jgi:hypothetical protein